MARGRAGKDRLASQFVKKPVQNQIRTGVVLSEICFALDIMNLIFHINHIFVYLILCGTTLFKKLNRNLTKQSVRQYVLILFNPFRSFFFKLVKLRLKQIRGAARYSLFIAYNLLSELFVNRNGSSACLLYTSDAADE